MTSSTATSPDFRFKQFSIQQSRCAMKVSTDACLFGAAARVEQARNILDIGTGTGLLALMAAQRSAARITAVELDIQAALQAEDNIAASPWAKRIKVYQQSIQAFAEQHSAVYDCILCNPPFFTAHLASPDSQRHLARHNDSLSFTALAAAAKRLLTSSGIFQVLLPVSEQQRFLDACAQQGLFPHEQLIVRPTSAKPAHRVILTLSSARQACQNHELIIHSGSQYSTAFQTLLKPYYLKL